MVEGFTYHLTHRCHGHAFLLRVARERNRYREWLRQGVLRHGVSVYGYCVTHNHTHVVARADDREGISALMHLAAGATAKQYNLRKERSGAMWEHPFHCTRIQDDQHLFNCLCYIDLNMVRAGVVAHPRDWRWCGYHELIGARLRYRLIDRERVATHLGFRDTDAFRHRYEEALEARIETRRLAREPHWTEAIAVGSESFVGRARADCPHRTRFELDQVNDGSGPTWILKESRPPYGAIPTSEFGCKPHNEQGR